MEPTLQKILSMEANLAAYPQTSEILKQRAELLLTASELLHETMEQKEKDIPISSYYQDQDSLTCETSHPT